MTAETHRKLLRWMVGGLIALLTAGGLLAYFAQEAMGSALGPGSLLGWVIPLGAVFVVIAVSWFLLAKQDPGAHDAGISYVACPSCGQTLVREWRMCPYCGAQVSRSQPADGPAPEV